MHSNRGQYRNTRIVIGIIHIFMQLIIMWNLYGIIMPLVGSEGQEDFILLARILINLGIIISLFAVYYLLIKLLLRGYQSSHEHR